MSCEYDNLFSLRSTMYVTLGPVLSDFIHFLCVSCYSSNVNVCHYHLFSSVVAANDCALEWRTNL